MESIGFKQLKYNSSLYFNAQTGVRVVILGDDFVAAGRRDEIGVFRAQVANRFMVKDKVVGMRADLGEVKETRILNRIIRTTVNGWEYEADQRHSELIINELWVGESQSHENPRRRRAHVEHG